MHRERDYRSKGMSIRFSVTGHPNLDDWRRWRKTALAGGMPDADPSRCAGPRDRGHDGGTALVAGPDGRPARRAGRRERRNGNFPVRRAAAARTGRAFSRDAPSHLNAAAPELFDLKDISSHLAIDRIYAAEPDCLHLKTPSSRFH